MTTTYEHSILELINEKENKEVLKLKNTTKIYRTYKDL